MGDPDHAEMWIEMRRLMTDLAGLGSRATAIGERVTAAEARISILEGWRGEHSQKVAATFAELNATLKALVQKVEEGMVVQKSQWDRVWQFLQPLILLGILMLLGLKGVKP